MNGSPGHSAIYPGSFDPLTCGHLDVIERAAQVFDRVLVAVVVNPQKREPLFSLPEREQMIVDATQHLSNVDVAHFRGLLADFVRARQANVIVKGLRVVADFESEMSTALMNRSLSGVDTVFLPSDPRWSFVSSTLVKEVFNLGADVAEYVPAAVLRLMQQKRSAPRAAER
ncbi:MAG: pantetheine-phosphate adenylyltransferase [Candidatus Eremiobacteraeota bacterium]|nr:pantetheine-phosphate adenylyltransferase [Candidatus Eremiobacteraeota bacterium]